MNLKVADFENDNNQDKGALISGINNSRMQRMLAALAFMVSANLLLTNAKCTGAILQMATVLIQRF